MDFNFTGKTREQVFQEVAKFLEDNHLNVDRSDFEKPWGGFFVIDESQADQFCALFFPTIKPTDLKIGGKGKLSPKVLLVEPHKRLSWQYHHRRAEMWKLVAGTGGVITSFTDDEGELTKLAEGLIIHLDQGQRHRLVGLSDWGMVAEIWRHTEDQHPSDEDDIVRVQDDFGRFGIPAKS